MSWLSSEPCAIRHSPSIDLTVVPGRGPLPGDWSSIWLCVQNNCAIFGLAMLRTPSHDLHWSSRAVSRYREYRRQTQDTRRRNLRNQSAHGFRTKYKHCLYILGGCDRHAGLFTSVRNHPCLMTAKSDH